MIWYMQKNVILIQKYKLIAVLWALSVTGQLWAQQPSKEIITQRDGWHTDLAVAKEVAKKEGKDILIEFTRSEGCGWCIKLEKEVLSHPLFQGQISKDYVLVMLNYPRDESLWTAEVRQKHEDLRRHYRVRHFPYLVFADANGRPYERSNYRDRKADDYLKQIMHVRAQRIRRDAAFREAEKLAGEQKARLLEKGLAEVSHKYHRYYPEVINAIDVADPSDASGFVAKVRVDEVKSKLGHALKSHYDERKFSTIITAVDQYLLEHKPKGEALQVALLYKVQAYYMAEHYEAAKTTADELTAINDASRSAHYANSLKKRIQHIGVK